MAYVFYSMYALAPSQASLRQAFVQLRTDAYRTAGLLVALKTATGTIMENVEDASLDPCGGVWGGVCNQAKRRRTDADDQGVSITDTRRRARQLLTRGCTATEYLLRLGVVEFNAMTSSVCVQPGACLPYGVFGACPALAQSLPDDAWPTSDTKG